MEFKVKEKKITKTYRMKPSQIEFLDNLAKKTGTSAADIVSQIVEQAMKQMEKGRNK